MIYHSNISNFQNNINLLKSKDYLHNSEIKNNIKSLKYPFLRKNNENFNHQMLLNGTFDINAKS